MTTGPKDLADNFRPQMGLDNIHDMSLLVNSRLVKKAIYILLVDVTSFAPSSYSGPYISGLNGVRVSQRRG